MPEISRFLGIIIAMFYRDHPSPHFHAIYGEYEIVIEIESGIINGRFPQRALKLVLEWSAVLSTRNNSLKTGDLPKIGAH